MRGVGVGRDNFPISSNLATICRYSTFDQHSTKQNKIIYTAAFMCVHHSWKAADQPNKNNSQSTNRTGAHSANANKYKQIDFQTNCMKCINQLWHCECKQSNSQKQPKENQTTTTKNKQSKSSDFSHVHFEFEQSNVYISYFCLVQTTKQKTMLNRIAWFVCTF